MSACLAGGAEAPAQCVGPPCVPTRRDCAATGRLGVRGVCVKGDGREHAPRATTGLRNGEPRAMRNGTKGEQGAACPGEARRQHHGCERGLQRAPPRRNGGCGSAARGAGREDSSTGDAARPASIRASQRARTLDERPRGRHLARRGDATSRFCGSRVRSSAFGLRGARRRPAGLRAARQCVRALHGFGKARAGGEPARLRAPTGAAEPDVDISSRTHLTREHGTHVTTRGSSMPSFCARPLIFLDTNRATLFKQANMNDHSAHKLSSSPFGIN